MREKGGDNRVGEGWEFVRGRCIQTQLGKNKRCFLLPFYYHQLNVARVVQEFFFFF